MPYLNGTFVTPDAYPAAVAETKKSIDIDDIPAELIASIYATAYADGWTDCMKEKGAIKKEHEILQQQIAQAAVN